jgi:GDP-L-fucose synthase
VANAVLPKGMIEFDTTNPDGAPRTLKDSMRLNALGWKARVPCLIALESSHAIFFRINAVGKCNSSAAQKGLVRWQ